MKLGGKFGCFLHSKKWVFLDGKNRQKINHQLFFVEEISEDNYFENLKIEFFFLRKFLTENF